MKYTALKKIRSDDFCFKFPVKLLKIDLIVAKLTLDT